MPTSRKRTASQEKDIRLPASRTVGVGEDTTTTPAGAATRSPVLGPVPFPASSGKRGSKGFDPALHVAAAEGDFLAVTTLLKGGFNVNTRDYEGRSALHIACAREDERLVRFMVSSDNCDVNAKDRHNRTPIMEIPKANARLRELMSKSGAVEDEKYFAAKQPNEESDQKGGDKKEETAEVVDSKFFRKLFAVVVIPFLYLLFVNGFSFALKFLASTLLFYFFCSGYFVADVTMKPPWYHHRPGATELTLKDLPDYWGAHVHNPKHNFGLEYEDVEFRNRDGMVLRGWYVPATNVPPKERRNIGIVFVHGGGRDRRAWLRHLPLFNRHGFSCLLFDFREHGLSDGAGRGLSYGMRERFDVSAAAKFLRDVKGFRRIAAVGTSVGGSSVIMAAAIDKNINVVVAENPILTCAHLQDKHMLRILGGYFKGTMWSKAVFRAFRFGASNWLNFLVGNKPSKKCQSMHVIGSLAPRPVLLLHGTYDDVVPPYHSERLFELAKEPKELWICPGARHCMMYNVDPDEFERRVIGFLKRYES